MTDLRALGNPWGLRPRQCEILDAYVQGGCVKRAASALSITSAAISEQVTSARRKMRVATTIQAMILWDRYRRGDKDCKWGIAV